MSAVFAETLVVSHREFPVALNESTMPRLGEFASLLWMWQVEKNRPDFWDVAGAVVCLIGAMIVLFGKRTG